MLIMRFAFYIKENFNMYTCMIILLGNHIISHLTMYLANNVDTYIGKSCSWGLSPEILTLAFYNFPLHKYSGAIKSIVKDE